MIKGIAQIAVLVDEYDRALRWYVDRLGFELVEDTTLPGGKRWVRVRAPGGGGSELLLSRAEGEEQRRRIGDQAGGRVLLFLHTDDFDRDHAELVRRGVEFVEAPRSEVYGKVAVLIDLYGNRMDLIQPAML